MTVSRSFTRSYKTNMSFYQKFIPGNEVNNVLYKAIYSGDLEKVSSLIESHGVSYVPAWDDGHQLLLTAIDCRHSDVVELLVKKGCKFRGVSESRSVFHLAVKLADPAIVALLLQCCPDAVTETDHGKTLLHVAVEEAREDMVTFLLERGSQLECRNYRGLTPLQLAAVIGHAEIIEILLKSGADIESQDPNGKTSLFLAVSSGHKTAVKTLLQYGASCSCRSINGDVTPLLDATSKGYLEIVKDLLAHGADLNDRTRLGQTPLHIACMHKNKNMISTLLNAGSDVNVTDVNDMVPSDAITKKVTPCSTFFEDSSISYLLGKHFLKLKTAGFSLHKKNELFFDTFYNMYCNEIVVGNIVFSAMSNVIHTTMKTCADEIERMKTLRIGHETSVFDVFQKFKDPLSLISEHELNYFKSLDIEEILPSYAAIIKYFLRQGKLRNKLIASSQECLSELLDSSELKLPVLPSEMIFKILTYLSNEELKQFVQFSRNIS